MTESEKYMTEALAEAEKALAAGEVPIGAVMVRKREDNARETARLSQEGITCAIPTKIPCATRRLT